jgi:hypothetical protein
MNSHRPAPDVIARPAIFFMPLVLGLSSTVGLVSALLADGVWDGLSWVALGAPVAVVLWAWRYRRRVGKRQARAQG